MYIMVVATATINFANSIYFVVGVHKGERGWEMENETKKVGNDSKGRSYAKYKPLKLARI